MKSQNQMTKNYTEYDKSLSAENSELMDAHNYGHYSIQNFPESGDPAGGGTKFKIQNS